MPSMHTVINPSSANGCRSLRATKKLRMPHDPVCGPGYTLSTIGYFFAASKFVGLNINPYKSVLPSRAFTTNGMGGTQPVALSFEISSLGNSTATLPEISRIAAFGGTAGDE